MKKIRFIGLVCKRLSELGASENEISKQRIFINKYLTGLGIAEEAPELDDEDPTAFAEEIFAIIKKHNSDDRANTAPQEEKSLEENKDNKVEIEEDEEDDEDDDVKVFAPSDVTAFDDEITEEDEEDYDSLAEGLEYENTEHYTDEDGTREFSISELTEIDKNGPFEEDDINESYDDDYDEDELDIKTGGNPVFFWILTVVLSPIWLSLATIGAALVLALYLLLSLFIILYIPLLILLILGGSVGIIAELVYSIIKFVTGNLHIGLFELGLGFALAAFIIFASVIIYRFGTKYAPRIWRYYFHGVAGIFRKIKRLGRRIKGVCSI